jgi:hypothetical protein
MVGSRRGGGDTTPAGPDAGDDIFKESLIEEYRALFDPDLYPPVGLMTSPSDPPSVPLKFGRACRI